MDGTGDLKLGPRLERIETKLDQVLIDVAGLKVKAGLWGGLLGAILGVGVSVVTNVISQT